MTRDLADAGWTCDEVQAWIHLTRGDVPARIKRPSGLLARRTASAHRIWTTPEQRAEMMELWRDSRAATAARHHDWTPEADTAQAGPPPAAAALMAQAVAPAGTHNDDQDQGEDLPLHPDGLPDPAAMTPAQLARVLAESEYAGPAYARALYGHDLVDRAYRLAPSPTLRLTGTGAR
ncbi:hypothetical protein [Embleya sp. NPDC005575]|uniref:hypothetical protein n=1 Tax=Embleya sp. NPDC005575 TaxID=3156892 RepID=UPI0033B380D8